MQIRRCIRRTCACQPPSEGGHKRESAKGPGVHGLLNGHSANCLADEPLTAHCWCRKDCCRSPVG